MYANKRSYVNVFTNTCTYMHACTHTSKLTFSKYARTHMHAQIAGKGFMDEETLVIYVPYIILCTRADRREGLQRRRDAQLYYVVLCT